MTTTKTTRLGHLSVTTPELSALAAPDAYWGLRHLLTGEVVQTVCNGAVHRLVAFPTWVEAREARRTMKLEDYCAIDRLTPEEALRHLALEGAWGVYGAVISGEVARYCARREAERIVHRFDHLVGVSAFFGGILLWGFGLSRLPFAPEAGGAVTTPELLLSAGAFVAASGFLAWRAALKRLEEAAEDGPLTPKAGEGQTGR